MTDRGALSIWQTELSIRTPGRGTTHITDDVREAALESGFRTGLVHVFCQHTSAGLILCENADPDVRIDLETFMQIQVPDGDSRFIHQYEGPDDMPAHVRTILTGSDVTIPISLGRLALGTWQGLYLWEHRTHLHERRLIVTISGC